MRPFRAVTASDDMTVNLYNGVPYKFAKSIKDHTRFVYDVRYSPDGKFFASTGADGKVRHRMLWGSNSTPSAYTLILLDFPL